MIPVRDNRSTARITPVIALIILANILVFAAEIRLPAALLADFSASPADLYLYLTHGEGSFAAVHRAIFAAGFMHAGYVHLIGNLLFLFVFGPAVEQAFGSVRFSLLYLLAIPLAFYAHAAVRPLSPVAVVGASGAIAAVMGAYLVFFPRARIVTIIPLLFIIKIVEVPAAIFMLGWFVLQGANGYLSISQASGVAWFAHIGGFILGVCAGMRRRWFA